MSVFSGNFTTKRDYGAQKEKENRKYAWKEKENPNKPVQFSNRNSYPP